MSSVVDKRGSNKNRLAGSRKRFIDRYRAYIKKKVNKQIEEKDLEDVAGDIEINVGSIEEPRARYNRRNGRQRGIHPGNRQFNKGDKISQPKDGSKRGGAGNSEEETQDDFTFVLTKEEFLDILFEDLQLPNFLKTSNKHMTKTSYVTGGYIKEGIPARLAIKKTLENAFARRISSGKPRSETRFLDDIDLRYRNLIPVQKPISSAVVFFVMDISGSMYENRKMLAKKFFLLYFLFLEKQYTTVELRFISHTTSADEVSQHDFFYSPRSGGTIVSSAFALVEHIIDSEYKLDETNFYVAQASDGDNWPGDNGTLLLLLDRLLPKLQYFTYIEVDNMYEDDGLAAFYEEHLHGYQNYAGAIIHQDSDVLKALHSLLKKDT